MFNGFYTITSPTGGYRTFRILTQDLKEEFAPGKRIIGMLIGEDNEFDYKDFGFVSDKGIHVWKSQRNDFFLKCATMLWSLSELGDRSPYAKAGVALRLDKRCLKCNRRLTNPVSLDLGIGPECMKGN